MVVSSVQIPIVRSIWVDISLLGTSASYIKPGDMFKPLLGQKDGILYAIKRRSCILSFML